MNRFNRVTSQVSPEVKRMLSEGLVDSARIQAALQGMNREEVARRAQQALAGVDQARLAEFGTMLQRQLAKQGRAVPAGLTQGDTQAIADALATMLKSQNMAEAKQALNNPALQKTAGNLVMGRLMAGGRFGLIGLLRDPAAAAVLGPVLKSLLRVK